MKALPPFPPMAGRPLSRYTVVLLALLSVCAGCRDREAEAARYARQTRQLRDATRMLDALESAQGTVPAALSAALATPSRGLRPDLASPYPDDPSAQVRDPRWLMLALPPAVLLLFHRFRRRRRTTMPDKVSLASLFADSVPPPVPRPATRAAAAPGKADVPAEPVASPEASGPPPADARLFEGHASMHLVGDARYPELHRAGDAPLPFDTWRDRLATRSIDDGPEATLAAWLLPALLVVQARSVNRRHAEELLDEAEALASTGLARAPDDARAPWIARLIRIELARIERQAGATRLFALRALQSRRDTDLAGEAPCLLDAWIDVQLAWAGWLLGEGAQARYAEAEALCDRLAALGGDAIALALKQRAAVALRQADTRRAPDQLPLLEAAQALLGDAFALDDDAHTALLIARTAHRLALTLPADAAADACSHALVHAFIAERHPAWRVDALECRLAVQLIYEGLPGRRAEGDMAASLERELVALSAESHGARLAMAAARLREGDFAGACALCDAAWRAGANDARLFVLWRDACRGWGATASASGRDREALSHAIRQLAVARSTT
ncbi:hypothetical protein P3W33_12730 [Luteibacter sp. PPL552]